ncbi:acyltransferase [Blautia sp. HCP3S3_D9]|uniref:acyltransferase n=1 Tax=Blautia sp. HCP3S3_D9 TaxID=3438912 RepID=UPI003F8A4427
MNKKKIIWLNYMKIFSIMMVILIHVIYQALLKYGNSITVYTKILGYSLKNLCWCAVPCFLMISGYLLLDEKKQYSIEYIIRHYIAKMVGILLTFGVLFAWIELIYSEKSISIYQVLHAIMNVLAGNTWSHLWYVYSMIGIYIMLPLYKMISEKITNKMLIYFLFIIVIYIGFFPILEYMGVGIGIKIPEFTFLVFWLFIGDAIRKEVIKISLHKAILLVLISMICLIGFTVIEIIFKVELRFLFGYSSIIVMGQAIGLAFIFKHINYRENSYFTSMVNKVSSNSLLIYVIHMLYVNLFYKMFKFNPFSFGTWWLIIIVVVTFVCLIITYITSWIIKKLVDIKVGE